MEKKTEEKEERQLSKAKNTGIKRRKKRNATDVIYKDVGVRI